MNYDESMTPERETLSPETVARLNELEAETGFVLEFRFGLAATSTVHRVTDPDYQPARVAELGERSSGLVPDDDVAVAQISIDGEGHTGHHVFHDAWCVRIRNKHTGSATPYGWPAPTMERCAEFLLWEIDRDAAGLPG